MQLRKMDSEMNICAISTPAGVGGIAIARISGPDAVTIAQSIWTGKRLTEVPSHTAHLGIVCDSQGQPLDQAVATVYIGPHSFTGEDVVELAVHGSRYVQSELIKSLILRGARLAEPGEFTRRAFAAGKMDLAQAEAVADIIASESRAAHRIAVNQMRGQYSKRLAQLREQLLTLASLLELELDFSEEDVEFASRQQLMQIAQEVKHEVTRLTASFDAGTAIKNGIPIAIVGATNAGKSSLLNALVGDDRAIVSDIHGTTRDIVEDTITIGDYTYRLMDTAGMRTTTDQIENIGIERSRNAARRARIVIMVIDATSPVAPQLPEHNATLIAAINKTDLDPSPSLPAVLGLLPEGTLTVEISAVTGAGIERLRETIESISSRTEHEAGSVMVTNARHYQSLLRASESISRVIESINTGLSGDLIALDIRLTIGHLNEILGEISSQDVLNTIFSRFCIGK